MKNKKVNKFKNMKKFITKLGVINKKKVNMKNKKLNKFKNMKNYISSVKNIKVFFL